MIHKAYKFRIYPNSEQRELLAKHFGCSRFIYNYFLNSQKEYYLKNKEKDEGERINLYKSKFDNINKLPILKKEFSWLKEVNAQSLQATVANLDVAYKSFFKKQNSFPKFKNKNSKQTFKVPQNTVIENKRLYIPKFKEGIKITQHREIEGRIINAVVSKNSAEQYFVSLTCEVLQNKLTRSSNQIGIDLGIKDFAVTSNNEKYSNPKVLRKHEDKIKYLQRQLSKKEKGSRNRNKARIKLARLCNKISNKRSDFLHKLSIKIINENQVIVLEDLNVKGMLQNHKLAKAISDCSWSSFVNMLQYKSNWHGRELIQVDRWFPSSKMCNHCKHINSNLKLSQRVWKCEQCNNKIDRDYNAAKNILEQGLNLTAVGAIVEKPVELLANKSEATKQEASQRGSS